MDEIGSYEAKTHLPKLLDRAARGERITITRHGVPVAALVPISPAAGKPAQETIKELRRFRRGRKLDGLSIRQLIDEGRR